MTNQKDLLERDVKALLSYVRSGTREDIDYMLDVYADRLDQMPLRLSSGLSAVRHLILSSVERLMEYGDSISRDDLIEEIEAIVGATRLILSRSRR